MTQPDLFTVTRQPRAPYQHTSQTSKDAAERARAFIGQQGATVLRWFVLHGPATQKEASAQLGIGRASICARVNALEQAGQLEKGSLRREGCAVYRVRR